MVYVIAIPVVLVLVLLVWVVTQMVRSREAKDRPAAATHYPNPPGAEHPSSEEVRR